MQTILTQSFPNREIRITLTREKPPAKFSYDDETLTLTSVQNSEPGCGECEAVDRDTVESSKSVQPTTARPGFGLLPKTRAFSMYMRRQLWRAGGAFDSTFGHKGALFLTTTIPGSTPEAFRAVAEWSAWIVDRFKSWLSKRGATAYSMYCWEWQRRGALHLHYVVNCDDSSIAKSIKDGLKDEWQRLIDGVCERSGIDVWRRDSRYTHANNKSVLQTKAEEVTRSVAAYLAKYLSKSYRSPKGEAQKFFAPSRWSGISRPLNALLRSLTREDRVSTLGDRDAYSRYEDALSLLQNTSIKCQEYRHKVGDGKTIIAYLDNSIKESVWDMLNAILSNQAANSSESNQKLERVVRKGLILMTGNTNWSEFFYRNCDSYVTQVALKLSASQRVTPLDQTALLDSLVWSFRWLLKTRLYPSGRESAWLNSATSLINEQSTPSSNCSADLPVHKLAQQGLDESASICQPGTRSQPQCNGTVPACNPGGSQLALEL